MHIDPTTATPCRTVAFNPTGKLLAEANYLGFLSIRDANNGSLITRFLSQTALVETIRFDPRTGNLLIVGAGFEGYRDFGAAKILTFPDGDRVGDLKGHTDDITDIAFLHGNMHRIVSVGLDKNVIVHSLENIEYSWNWHEYKQYLNTVSTRPQYDGHFAVAGDSLFTYVLDANFKSVVAKIETPGDSNGLAWSHDGRFLIVGDDHSVLKYFDSQQDWDLVASKKLGGAIKKAIHDPRFSARGLAACYDGQIWSFPLNPFDSEDAFVAVPRTRGMWGINVDATKTRIAVPTFYDRSFLFSREENVLNPTLVGDRPKATYGCNWVDTFPSMNLVAITHDDAKIRFRNAMSGELLKEIGGESDSLYMGCSFHPSGKFLATIDFYGEIWIYDCLTGSVTDRRQLPFGPGISVAFSQSGNHLVVGGYRWDAYVVAVSDFGMLGSSQLLEKPNQGVIKNVCFAGKDRILTASGDGTSVLHEVEGGVWHPRHHFQVMPSMELCNGVVIADKANCGYVVSRDQTVRSFCLETGRELGVGYAHTRSVKCLSISSDETRLVTGSYDRTVLIWDAKSLKPISTPIRFGNSGVSSVKIFEQLFVACSFDGHIICGDLNSGRVVWRKDSQDTAWNV